MNINMINSYLNEKITNWYKNAELDYGVTGRFISANVVNNDLVISYEEMGQQSKVIVAYYADYTPEQIYNIWMEEA